MVECTFSEDNTEIFPTTIETERLRLEFVGNETVDVYELFAIQNQDEFGELLQDMPGSRHITPQETAEEIVSSEESFAENEGASYIIYIADSGEIVGRAGFGIDWDNREMQCFVWVLDEYQGRGYSTERGEAFVKLAFEEFNLATVRVGAAVGNEASQKAIQNYIVSNGGTKEGCFRNFREIDGVLRDIIYYSITQSEWESNSP